MRPRTLKILGALFVVLAAAWGLALRASRTPAPKENFLWGKAQAAKRLIIGDTILTKSGPDWNIEEPFKTKADRSKVEDFLGKLSKVTLSDAVSSDPSRHGYFMVTPSSGVRLQGYLDEKGGAPAMDVLVGKEGSDYDTVMLRHPSENDVLEGRGVNHYDFEPGASKWADRSIARIDAAAVRSIELRTSSETLKLSRTGGQWRLNGVDTALSTATVSRAIDPMLAKLSALDADDVMQETALSSTTIKGLKKPDLRVFIHYNEGAATGAAKVVEKTLELTVAPKGGDSRYAVRKKGENLVYLVSNWQLDPLRKKMADFK